MLKIILDWSEAWAPLIPLTIYFIRKPRSNWVRPVAIYLIVAFVFLLCADIVWKRKSLHIKEWLEQFIGPYLHDSNKAVSNNIFYNLNSIFRFLIWCWFFNYIGQAFKKVNRFLPPVFLLLVIINYIFFQRIHDFSSRQFTTESVLLLFYCLVYFYTVNKDEHLEIPSSQPHFWAVTGLTLFFAVNFFIVLFYSYLIKQNIAYAKVIWNVQNINNIIFHLFIALSFLKAK